MRIPEKHLHRWMGWTGAGLFRAWLGTTRQINAYEDWRTYFHDQADDIIYAIWHESILAATHAHRDRGTHVLISQSRDGEYIANIVERLGYHAVRGSSSRGSLRAIRQMNRAAGQSSLAITPDGPRGPRRVFQPGAVYLASRTGMPITPVGIAHSRAWRAKSWDRFVVPAPFSRIAYYFNKPIHVPADLGPDDLEVLRLQAQASMELAEHRAWRLLGRETGELAADLSPAALPAAKEIVRQAKAAGEAA